MNKRAFTLIELLSIMTLLGIMVVLVLPQISGSIESRKNTQYNNIVNTIKSAAKVYYSDNDQTSLVSVETLIQNDYLSSGLTNPVTGDPINGCILIEKDSSGYNVYNYYEDCNDLTEYTMTNLITNGSFESDGSGWSLSAYNSISTSNKKFGTKSLKTILTSNTWASAQQTYSVGAALTIGHKYYYSNWAKSVALDPSISINYLSFYNSIGEWRIDSGIPVYTQLYDWKRFNTLFTLTDLTITSGHLDPVSWFSGTKSAEVYSDGLLLVDLTATFGAGNEPTKEWCDNNINYFDGTKTIYAENNGTSEYTISNIVANGSLESGTTSWTFYTGVTRSNIRAKFGTYSARNYQASVLWTNANNSLTPSTAISGHKYYVMGWLYTVSRGTNGCYMDANLIYDGAEHWQASVSGFQTNLNVWEKQSKIYTMPSGTSPSIAVALAVNSETTVQECYADGALIVDLTAAFGAGNEPTKEWCDANLDYFEGSIVVRK